MTNRLASALSPYLLQHKDNPVDWHEWGDEAFAEARERDVPILLSVGYAACHWCHVMAHESFEDPVVAALMNAHYVNIKVDREERPDVDAAYMAAVQALTRQGGWPMTVFTTPDGRPFHAGTYYPPRPAHGRASFTQILEGLAEVWASRRAEVEEAASALAGGVREAGASALISVEVPATSDDLEPLLSAAASALASTEDPLHAGFGGAPKFPPSTALEFLLRRAAVDPPVGDLAARTLRVMAHSGMYDQLAGGFARYAVDRAWVVPHFEKMLYDNALLARVYLHWWRLSGDATGARVAAETCAFMLAGLATPGGGLASALDADTLGQEGLTSVWRPSELVEVLGEPDAAWAAELLGVTAEGTFEEGASTLRLTRDVWGAATTAGESVRWVEVRARLMAARALRPQPACDDKVVAAWNGLAIAALAECGVLLGRPDLMAAAETIAEYLVRVHLRATPEGARLCRVSREGLASAAPGVLEDYADVAEGLLVLYGATGEARWLRVAGELLDTVLDTFRDSSGRLLDTASDAQDPALQALGRGADPADQPCPSGTAAAAGALLTYGRLVASPRHLEASASALGAVQASGARAPRFFGWGLAVLQSMASGPCEVLLTGEGERTDLVRTDLVRSDLLRTALMSVEPGLVIGHQGSAFGFGPLASVPSMASGPDRGSSAAAVVCRDQVCSLPLSDLAELSRVLAVRRA